MGETHWDVLHAADLLRDQHGGPPEALPLDVCQRRQRHHFPSRLCLAHQLRSAKPVDTLTVILTLTGPEANSSRTDRSGQTSCL